MPQVVQGSAVDPCSVGLEQRPQREDADMIQPNGSNVVKIFGDSIPIRMQPEIEPVVRGGVIDSKFHDVAIP